MPADITTGHKILIASVYGSQDIQEQITGMGLKNRTIILSEK